MGKSTIHGPFSIAMLVYQRVNETMNIQLHPFLQLHSFRCPVRPRCRVASDQRVPPVAGPGSRLDFSHPKSPIFFHLNRLVNLKNLDCFPSQVNLKDLQVCQSNSIFFWQKAGNSATSQRLGLGLFAVPGRDPEKILLRQAKFPGISQSAFSIF